MSALPEPPVLSAHTVERPGLHLVAPDEPPDPDELPTQLAVPGSPPRDVGDSAGTPPGMGQQARDLRRGHWDSDTRDARCPRTAWTAPELLAERFKPPRFAVPGIVTEGLNLFVCPPKVGKSWLGLGLAVSVATGDKALGKLDVAAGPVLYLALEDTPRRLQSRLKGARSNHRAAPGPDGGHRVRAAAPGGRRADHRLARPPSERPAGRHRRVRPGPGRHPEGNVSLRRRLRRREPDHAHRRRLRRGRAAGHHVRKQGSDDFLTEVSGTNGLAGAADTVLVLKRSRGSADGVLHVTGRDVNETEYALRFNAEHGAWQLLDGPAVDHLFPRRRARSCVTSAHPGARPKRIAEATGLDYENVKKTCVRMAERGQLHTGGQGSYTAPGESGDTEDPAIPVPVVPAVPIAGQRPTRLSPDLSPEAEPGYGTETSAIPGCAEDGCQNTSDLLCGGDGRFRCRRHHFAAGRPA